MCPHDEPPAIFSAFHGGPAIVGTKVFIPLFNSPGALVTVDVSNPAAPSVDATFTEATLDTAGYAAVSGSFVYVTSGFLGSGANTLDMLGGLF
jgi:hypothetical protein